MSLEWALGVLVSWVLVGWVCFRLGRLSASSALPMPGKKPSHPSVFVDMDDKPPMEIDFEAGIRANQRTLRKNSSQEEASG
ncbi:hypothetical protein [Meiothermus sp.]|uniref:hypothetical protein n=1 Tax=Meiothermus sp. TaxID=1955249 RepID=UPI0021DB8B4F|nr:hypothetical protein [Meiothermus sp.]GIW24773.1 MAG: hypothetical protein KatS3mg069_1040 [Meiothermus sp.]